MPISPFYVAVMKMLALILLTSCSGSSLAVNDAPPDLGCASPAGFYDDLSGTIKVQAGYLIAEPITIDCTTTLNALGVISRSQGALVSIGLYDSNTADPANPFPANRLAYANDQTISTVGRNEFATAASTLKPGAYWIATVYSMEAPVAASTPDGSSIGIQIASPKPSSSELPEIFPAPPARQVTRVLNYYAVP
jgi:hypothetical protein